MDRLTESYLDYDPENDPSGAIGLAIAEQIYKKYGPDFKKLKLDMSLKRLERSICEKNIHSK